MLDLSKLTKVKPEEQIPEDSYTFFIVPFTYTLCPTAKDDRKDVRFFSDSPITHSGHAASTLSILDNYHVSSSAFVASDTANIVDTLRTYESTVYKNRWSYLLPETQLTLFERARWFRLRTVDTLTDIFTGSVMYSTRGKKDQTINHGCEVTVSAELVLFEWPPGHRHYPGAHSTIKLPQVGFLLFVVHINADTGEMPETQKKRFNHLLNCNERLRYITKPPYPGVECCITLENMGVKPRLQSTDLWQALLSLQIYDDEEGYRTLQFADVWYGHGGRNRAAPPLPEQEHAFTRGYPDNRAFVYTYACVREDHATPAPKTPLSAAQQWQRAWFSLLDVDGGYSLSSPLSSFEQRWLQEHSYERWRESGGFYGFTDFSAAHLVDADKGWSLTYDHFRQMYLDQLLLLLYERVSLFWFSATISAFTHSLMEKRRFHAQQEFNRLRQQFMLMTNLYQFPMFTTQQQGLEMYKLARRHLDIQDLYGEIATEIGETEAYFAQERDNRRNSSLAMIQWVGAVLAFAALALTGMQVLEVQGTQWAHAGNVLAALPLDVVRLVVSAVIGLGVLMSLIILLWRIGAVAARRWLG